MSELNVTVFGRHFSPSMMSKARSAMRQLPAFSHALMRLEYVMTGLAAHGAHLRVRALHLRGWAAFSGFQGVKGGVSKSHSQAPAWPSQV